MKALPVLSLLLLFLATGCTGQRYETPTNNSSQHLPNKTPTSHPVIEITSSPTAIPLMVLHPTPTNYSFGPDVEPFPGVVNTLTGELVDDTESLLRPAVLVSISNSPVTARPQAGLAFAPNVYELFIGEGTTRFLAVFYGDMPKRATVISNALLTEPSLTARRGLTQTLSGRVWVDEDQNGAQDPWEVGVGGVNITIIGAGNGKPASKASSDSNGYFAVDTQKLVPGETYQVSYLFPDQWKNQNRTFQLVWGGDSLKGADLGINTMIGEPVRMASDIAPQKTYVGPIRSGRLTYDDINRLFPGSCLVFASAGEGILERLNPCRIIYGEEGADTPNTSLLEVEEMVSLANESTLAQPPNYSGNLFSTQLPEGGVPAQFLDVVFHKFAMSRWQYDPLSMAYLRYTDSIDGTGVLHPDQDRLTGRQIAFENIVVLFSNYAVFRHGQYDVDLCCGYEGYAVLFRDGQMFKIRWNTNNREWEQKTGLLRPIKFVGDDKEPVAFRPGKTWIALVTPNSVLTAEPGNCWQMQFAMPNDVAPDK